MKRSPPPRSPPPQPPPQSSPPPPLNLNLLLGILIGSAITIGSLLAAGLMVFWLSGARMVMPPRGPEPVAVDRPEVAKAPEGPSGQTPEDMAREEEQKRKEAIAQARKQLADAWGGRTTDGIRMEAGRLVQEVEKLRKGTDTEPGLKIMLDGAGDPSEIAARAIAAAEQADKVVGQPEEAADFVANLEAAAKELAATAGLLEATVKRVPEIAAAERKALADAMRQQQDAAAAQRRREAFDAFKKQGSITVELPVPDPAEPAVVSTSNLQVDLGPFAAQDLVEPTLRLAVPEETLNGVPFAAEIVAAAADRWEIRCTKGYTGLDGTPQTIATLESSQDGMLVLQVEPKMLAKRPVAILRRCVILAEAKDPETKQPLVREIRLVKPKPVGLLTVAATGGKQAMPISVPPGIVSRDTPQGGVPMEFALPVSGVEVVGEWGGKKETKRLPERGTPDQPGIVTWQGIQVGQLGDGVMLELEIALSLPQATLAATPVLTGPNSAGFDLEKMTEFLEKWAAIPPELEKKFQKRIAACPGRDFKKATGTIAGTEVKAWFTKPLATAEQMKLDLPGHETIQSSMDQFFRAEYQRLAEEKRLQWEREIGAEKDERKKRAKQAAGPGKPDFPNGFDDWFTRCGNAKEQDWPREFESRLDAWSQWFWTTFETQWKTTEALASKISSQIDVRLLEITSIARAPDEPSKEYRVPLVQFDASAPVARPEAATGGRQPPGGTAATEPARPDAKSTAPPARATGL